MSEYKHLIWSNTDLNYEDWRADLEAEYPELSEDERIERMYELTQSSWMMSEQISISSWICPS